MRAFRQLLTYALAALLLAACSRSGHPNNGPPPVGAVVTFSATVTSVEIDRTADQQALAVTGLPAEGATISLQE